MHFDVRLSFARSIDLRTTIDECSIKKKQSMFIWYIIWIQWNIIFNHCFASSLAKHSTRKRLLNLSAPIKFLLSMIWVLQVISSSVFGIDRAFSESSYATITCQTNMVYLTITRAIFVEWGSETHCASGRPVQLSGANGGEIPRWANKSLLPLGSTRERGECWGPYKGYEKGLRRVKNRGKDNEH